jgi:Domain of Unknown Function (DUF748)
VLVVYTAFGFLGVPILVKSQLEKRLTAVTERVTTVGDVRFNPFSWQATLTDFALQGRTPGPPLLTLREVVADVSAKSVWHWAPVLEALRIAGPHVHLARLPDGQYDVQDLIDRALAETDEPAPEFSLNNIEITDGTIAFDDRVLGRQHTVADLTLRIPFLSTLPVDVEVNVTPQLRAKVNGTSFALEGATTPFAQNREAALAMNLDALPLPKYVAYLPYKLNRTLAGGALTTRMHVIFRDGGGTQPALQLTGDARVDDFELTRSDGAPLLAAKRVGVSFRSLRLFARDVDVAELSVEAPQVELRRAQSGEFEWQQPLLVVAPSNASAASAVTSGATAVTTANATPPATAPAHAASTLPSAAAAAQRKASPAKAWKIVVHAVKLREGVVRIADETVTPAFRAQLSEVTVDGSDFTTTAGTSGSIKATAKSDLGASLAIDAQVEPAALAARGHLRVASLQLAKLYPYYAEALNLEVGSGALEGAADFTVERRDTATQFQVTHGTATLDGLSLGLPGERTPLWRIPKVVLSDIALDPAARTIEIGAIASRGGRGRVRREANGSLNWARLLKTSATTGRGDAETWTLRAARAQVDDYALDVDDRIPSPPVRLRVRQLSGTVEDVSNAGGARSKLDVRLRVGDRGRVAVNGAFATNPASANIALDANGLALAPLQPYLDDVVNVTITAGSVGAKGRLVIGAASGNGLPPVTFKGDVTVADFAALDKPTTRDLARWKALALEGVEAASNPQALTIAAVKLTDFYARVIVYEDATLNLARLLTPGTAPVPPLPGAAAPVAQREVARRRAALPIAIGRIDVARGEVQFSDFFVRPNYSADLTDVRGTVSRMTAEQAGDIAVTAKVEGSAPVEISGKLQPFATELTLDLAGSARDIELSPLTPYAAKYAGYAIEKGKLSFDAAYRIEDRKLTAQNKLVLDQLTFGERVDSPTATKLPVLLAVSLLKDRNGVIDIELPIAGSLDDPEFSVGGLIVRVIVNLITKAVTAPFALLGALAGGGAELSYVEFAPGSAIPAAAGATKLAALAKALADRPGLKLEIVGRVDPNVDRAALANAAYDDVLKAQKMKALVARNEAPASVADVTLTADERSTYLKAAYRATEIPDRPRNLFGVLKDVPDEQMESMLRKHTAPVADALGTLATDRAQTAKAALLARGIPAGRLFIVAPKANAAAPKEGPPTRVDFALR